MTCFKCQIETNGAIILTSGKHNWVLCGQCFTEFQTPKDTQKDILEELTQLGQEYGGYDKLK